MTQARRASCNTHPNLNSRRWKQHPIQPEIPAWHSFLGATTAVQRRGKWFWHQTGDWHIISQLLAQTCLWRGTPLQRWRHSLIWQAKRRQLNLYLACPPWSHMRQTRHFQPEQKSLSGRTDRPTECLQTWGLVTYTRHSALGWKGEPKIKFAQSPWSSDKILLNYYKATP